MGHPDNPRYWRKEPIFDELPIGFSMELAKNPAAMSRFASLTEEEKRALADNAHAISSREEMRTYVETLAAADPTKTF